MTDFKCKKCGNDFHFLWSTLTSAPFVTATNHAPTKRKKSEAESRGKVESIVKRTELKKGQKKPGSYPGKRQTILVSFSLFLDKVQLIHHQYYLVSQSTVCNLSFV